MTRDLRSRALWRAFTLVELIVVIVVLAIRSGVAIPKYFDYATRAKEAACRGALGAVRSGIANFHSNAIVATGTAAYPTLAQMQAVGTVMQEPLPANPYNNSSSVVSSTWAATPPVSGNAGWAYDAVAGKFWANSNTTGVGENAW